MGSIIDIVFLAFKFFGGFGMFIYGMHVMSEGLQKSAGSRLNNILDKSTNNRFKAVGVGAAITALIQSSSATTVMVVGFVNASILSLGQAVGVIMGANIGTTITAWIVSSSEWFKVLKPSHLAPLTIGIGAILLFFVNNRKYKKVAEILVGFGMIFIGLDFMKDALEPVAELEGFQNAFVVIGSNPVLGILVGAVLTAVIQSSSASVGILQTMAIAGLVPWNAAVYIILGQNIGTCVTALLSSVNASKTAKRAAIIHLMFNVVGTTIFAIISILGFTFWFKDFGTSGVDSVGISVFHTIFNVTSTLILFPFANQLVAISKRVIPGEEEKVSSKSAIVLKHLDERILETPQFAIDNAVKEIVLMGEYALENVKLGSKAFINKDYNEAEDVLEREVFLNQYERMITDYLVKISNTALSETQVLIVNDLFHTVNDIERIGDHAENLAELAIYGFKSKLSFSSEAIKEFKTLTSLTVETVEDSLIARREYRMEAIKRVEQYEDEVDELEETYRETHIKRLAKGICQTTSGVIFLDAIGNLERISDHALNIALYVKDEII